MTKEGTPAPWICLVASDSSELQSTSIFYFSSCFPDGFFSVFHWFLVLQPRCQKLWAWFSFLFTLLFLLDDSNSAHGFSYHLYSDALHFCSSHLPPKLQAYFQPPSGYHHRDAYKIFMLRGSWVVQLVKHPTPDFGSGHDLMVHEFEPYVGLCADSSQPGTCFGLCLPLSLPLPCLSSVSQK